MRTALLLIDLQNDYFEGGKMELTGAAIAGENARKVLERFRNKGLPVFHIQHIATRSTATFFLPGTKGADIYPSLCPAEGEKIVVKHYPNSFRETDLLDALQRKGIGRLVICGMMTHMCVDATARAAKDFGFDCVVVGDACATKSLEIDGHVIDAEAVHNGFLAALNYFYATVSSTGLFLQDDF